MEEDSHMWNSRLSAGRPMRRQISPSSGHCIKCVHHTHCCLGDFRSAGTVYYEYLPSSLDVIVGTIRCDQANGSDILLRELTKKTWLNSVFGVATWEILFAGTNGRQWPQTMLDDTHRKTFDCRYAYYYEHTHTYVVWSGGNIDRTRALHHPNASIYI